ncbi:MAG: usg protein [Rickettsiales bacterium]|nr:usg protein [Rickettsiales bacterium]
MALETRELELMLRDYRLTTAEILYHFPDHPALLQTYVWQELDLAPKFPTLKKFLAFWERELDGKLHSVKVMHAEIITPHEFKLVNAPIVIH